jgi:hypothetical protein
MLTFDRALSTDSQGNARGASLGFTATTHDGKTVDSTGSFLIGELERLDQTLHEPLVETSWGRDIDLREDVTIGDEVTSFMISTYAASGGLGTGNGIGNGKNWIGKNTDQIPGAAVDLAKIPHPLRLWGMELKYTIPELASAAQLGRPIDQQKFDAMKQKHDMDIDEQVYIGDTPYGDFGLLNLPGVTATNVLPGTESGTPTKWSLKSPLEILADINTGLQAVWAASGWKIMPTRALIPPAQFGLLTSTIVSIAGVAGGTSIMKFLLDNNILTSSGRGRLEILPLKWCIGAGAGGVIGTLGTVDRMVIYTKNPNYVRFPMTLLQKTPIQYESIYHKTTYYCKLGVVENPYPQTVGYFDQI